MDTYKKLEVMNLIDNYPIFMEYKQLGVKGLRCKLALIAKITSNTSGMLYEEALRRLCIARGVSYDMIPPLPEAAYWARVGLNFLNDYNKVQYMFENSPIIGRMNRYLMSMG